MAIIVPHQSSQGIGVGNAGQAAPCRSTGEFITPGERAMPDALRQLAGGMDRLSGEMFKLGLEKLRMQNAADLLADKVDYEDAVREFESEYFNTHRGVSARDAVEAGNAFHQKRREILKEKWGGNPYLMEAANKMAEGIRGPSLNRLADWSDREEEFYRQATLEASQARSFLIFNNPDIGFAEKQARLSEEERNLRLFAGQKPVRNADGSIGWTGGRNVDAELMALRKGAYLGHLDGLIVAGKADEAQALLNGRGKNAQLWFNLGGKYLTAKEKKDYLEKIDIARSKIEHDRKEAEKREHEQNLNQYYDAVYSKLQGLSWKEMEIRGRAMIAELECSDGDKAELNDRLTKDLRMAKEESDSTDYLLASQYLKRVREEGMNYSQAAAGVSQIEGMSEEGQEKLIESLKTQGQEITPENEEASMDLLREIDRGKVAEERQINAWAFNHELTDSQTEQARKYLNDSKGRLSLSRVEQIYRNLNGGQKLPSNAYNLLLDNLEPGKPVSDKAIGEVLSNFCMQEGKTTGWFWNSHESYAEAKSRNKGKDWRPNVTPEEREKIIAILQAEGVKNISEERISLYKKHEIMGISDDEEAEDE